MSATTAHQNVLRDIGASSGSSPSSRRDSDPDLIADIRALWADAATRSVAQEADAVVKLYAAGLLARAVPGQRSYCAVEAYDALGLGAMPSPA